MSFANGHVYSLLAQNMSQSDRPEKEAATFLLVCVRFKSFGCLHKVVVVRLSTLIFFSLYAMLDAVCLSATFKPHDIIVAGAKKAFVVLSYQEIH